MKIAKEYSAKEWGEHDFFFETESVAHTAAGALAKRGFMVGGGFDPLKITINTEMAHPDCIKYAKKLIAEIKEANDGQG